MSGFAHLRRYAQKKKSAEIANVEVAGDGSVVYNGARFDLRSGKKLGKQPGFRFTLDGKSLSWVDGALAIHHKDRVVQADISGSISQMVFVGDLLVVSDDGRKPYLVLDANTGKALDRFEGQLPTGKPEQPVYNPGLFDPHDGATLWLNEGARLAQFDVRSRKAIRVIDAPVDHRFFGIAALPDGHVMTIVRAKEHGFDTHADRLAVFTPDNKMTAIDGSAMSLEVLGSSFITADPRGKQFMLFDTKLDVIDTVPLYEPAADAWVRVLTLPSGREWLGVGGHGEWDHYGAPELGPKPDPKGKPRSSARAKRPTRSG